MSSAIKRLDNITDHLSPQIVSGQTPVNEDVAREICQIVRDINIKSAYGRKEELKPLFLSLLALWSDKTPSEETCKRAKELVQILDEKIFAELYRNFASSGNASEKELYCKLFVILFTFSNTRSFINSPLKILVQAEEPELLQKILLQLPQERKQALLEIENAPLYDIDKKIVSIEKHKQILQIFLEAGVDPLKNHPIFNPRFVAQEHCPELVEHFFSIYPREKHMKYVKTYHTFHSTVIAVCSDSTYSQQTRRTFLQAYTELRQASADLNVYSSECLEVLSALVENNDKECLHFFLQHLPVETRTSLFASQGSLHIVCASKKLSPKEKQEIFRIFQKEGCDLALPRGLNELSYAKTTVANYFAETGQLESLKLFLEILPPEKRLSSLQEKDYLSINILVTICKNENLSPKERQEFFRVVLEAGLDPFNLTYFESNFNISFAHYCILNDDLENLQLFLELLTPSNRSFLLNLKGGGSTGIPPLYLVSKVPSRKKEFFQYLLANGADPLTTYQDQNLAWQFAYSSNRYYQPGSLQKFDYTTLEVFLECLTQEQRKIIADSKLDSFLSPFYCEVIKLPVPAERKIALLDMLLQAGANVNLVHSNGDGLLQEIIKLGAWEVLESLDPNVVKKLMKAPRVQRFGSTLFFSLSDLAYTNLSPDVFRNLLEIFVHRFDADLLSPGLRGLTLFGDLAFKSIFSTVAGSREETVEKIGIVLETAGPLKNKLLEDIAPNSPLLQTYLDFTTSYEVRSQKIQKMLRDGYTVKRNEPLAAVFAALGDHAMLRFFLSITPEREDRIKLLTAKNFLTNSAMFYISVTNNLAIRHALLQVAIDFDIPLQFDQGDAHENKFCNAFHQFIGQKETLIYLFEHLPAAETQRLLKDKDHLGHAPIHTACCSYSIPSSDARLATIKLLLEHGADPLETTSNQENLVHLLIKQKDLSSLEACLQLCPHQNAQLVQQKTKYGSTPLMHALRVKGDGSFAEEKPFFPTAAAILIKAGVDLMVLSENGKTILQEMYDAYLIQWNQYNATAPLIEFSPILDFLPPEKQHELAKKSGGNSRLVQLWYNFANPERKKAMQSLLAAGEDPMIPDPAGRTLMHYLMEEGDDETMQCLFTYNREKAAALLNKPNSQGETLAFSLFKEGRNWEKTAPVFATFLRHGLNIRHQNDLGFTVVDKLTDLRISTSSAKIIEILIEMPDFFANCIPYQISALINFLLKDHNTKEVSILLQKIKDRLSYSSVILDKMIQFLQNNPDTHFLSEFEKYLMGKLQIYGGTQENDEKIGQLFDVALSHKDEFTQAVQDLRLNEKLSVDPTSLQRVLELFKMSKMGPYNESVRIAIQTCHDINLLEMAVKDLSLPAVQTKEAFLALSKESQKALLARFVVFRDRAGLTIACSIIRQAAQTPDAQLYDLVKLAFDLIEKTQILADPEEDEIAILELICALLMHASSHVDSEIDATLAKAVLALSKLDVVRLQKQYRPGIYIAFLEAKKRNHQELLLGSILALFKYSYDMTQTEDQKIIASMIALAKEKSTTVDRMRILAGFLSTVRDHNALMTAWDIVQSPVWDHHLAWEGAQNKCYPGAFDSFAFRPTGFHDNRQNVQKKILDVLGIVHRDRLKEKQEEIYKDFTKNPTKYPSLLQFTNKMKNIPDSARYIDPYYLPENAFVFRGINARKGADRELDAVADLFIRGAGDSELTRGKAEQATWAKIGQVFCALSIGYAKSYAGDAFIVFKGDYINEEIYKRKARAQLEGSYHYILYDIVSHENIERIYVVKDLYEELHKLRDCDPDHPPKNLKHFSNLHDDQLKMLILAIKKDPYQIFSKIEKMDSSQGFPKEKETPFKEVIKENVHREIMRGLVKTNFGLSMAEELHAKAKC